MEVKAVAKWIRMSPRKVRRVMNEIRGKNAEQALTILRFMPQAAAEVVKKVLHSAMANAEHNNNLDKENLFVLKAFVDGGPTLKRFNPRARGRAFPILKRSSHVTVIVGNKS